MAPRMTPPSPPQLLAAKPARTLSSYINSPSSGSPPCTNAPQWHWEGVPEAACLDGVGPAGICIPSFRS